MNRRLNKAIGKISEIYLFYSFIHIQQKNNRIILFQKLITITIFKDNNRIRLCSVFCPKVSVMTEEKQLAENNL